MIDRNRVSRFLHQSRDATYAMSNGLTATSAERIPERLAFPVAETALLLGIGKTKTRELIASGELGSIRAGRRLLVPRREIEAYIGRHLAQS
jgi:excisionase family DNA binding protein